VVMRQHTFIRFACCIVWRGISTCRHASPHNTTNRQVAGSIPDGVIGIFQLHPSGRTMALGSTQPVTGMITRCISWGKVGRCVKLTTLPPSCAVVMKSGNLNFLETPGSLQACNGSALRLPYSRSFTPSPSHHINTQRSSYTEKGFL
jgi:hypothetical protein